MRTRPCAVCDAADIPCSDAHFCCATCHDAGGLTHDRRWGQAAPTAGRLRAALDAAPETAPGDAWRGSDGPQGSEWRDSVSPEAGGAESDGAGSNDG